MEKTYQLDKFLTVEYMKELVQNNGFKIENEPPLELGRTLEFYKQHLKRALQAPYIMREEEEVQVKIPVNQEEYYLMKWNIPKIKYLINRNNISKTSVSVDLVKSLIQPHNSDNPASENVQKDEKDIIVVSYPPIASKYIMLQGNMEAFEKGKEGAKTLDAFVLEPSIHLRATISTVYRSLFAIHFNYSLICSYLAGQLTMEEIKKGDFRCIKRKIKYYSHTQRYLNYCYSLLNH